MVCLTTTLARLLSAPLPKVNKLLVVFATENTLYLEQKVLKSSPPLATFPPKKSGRAGLILSRLPEMEPKRLRPLGAQTACGRNKTPPATCFVAKKKQRHPTFWSTTMATKPETSKSETEGVQGLRGSLLRTLLRGKRKPIRRARPRKS